MNKPHEKKSGLNSNYWRFNCPLQVRSYNENPDDDTSKLIIEVLNYMPRKEGMEWIELNEVLDEQTAQEYFHEAAAHLRNLARLFDNFVVNGDTHIYYPDTGME